MTEPRDILFVHLWWGIEARMSEGLRRAGWKKDGGVMTEGERERENQEGNGKGERCTIFGQKHRNRKGKNLERGVAEGGWGGEEKSKRGEDGGEDVKS